VPQERAEVTLAVQGKAHDLPPILPRPLSSSSPVVDVLMMVRNRAYCLCLCGTHRSLRDGCMQNSSRSHGTVDYFLGCLETGIPWRHPLGGDAPALSDVDRQRQQIMAWKQHTPMQGQHGICGAMPCPVSLASHRCSAAAGQHPRLLVLSWRRVVCPRSGLSPWRLLEKARHCPR
jgi:hypothetical protein